MAIYHYGDENIRSIISYGEIDQEHGYILTPDKLYYSFAQKDVISLQEITSLTIKKQRQHNDQYIIHSSDDFIIKEDISLLFDELRELTEINIILDMNPWDSVHYYSEIILRDIREDNYEDIILTPLQEEKIEAYMEILSSELTDADYHIEMEFMGDKMMSLVEELEIDSEEIDALEKANNILQQKQSELFNQYQNMYLKNKDQLENIMGFNLDDLENKSPDELNQMVDDLCNKFNLNKESLMKMAQKMSNKKTG
ncbi:hypothetical protein [Eggerthia catenaformis]|uniref:hypothetical protein n=1 Tax=Eggerthia catenaformis TaxID=31973 RepID=UPI0012B5D899|nr:hypothetical protein [Eggerthia catenaformis]